MARSRKNAWLRDELILALDLYRREGRNPSDREVEELSALLRSIPIEPVLADDPRFRNTTGVRLKVSNFVSIDPAAETQGMSRGGRGDQEVFDEFGTDEVRLREAAEAIRANAPDMDPQPPPATPDEDDDADAEEGRILTIVHRSRERSRRLREQKKAKVLDETGQLACEACGFDFASRYGDRGEGYIEVHHTVPLADLRPGTRTRLSDLALVCANCHRMIHRRAEWLTISEVQGLLA